MDRALRIDPKSQDPTRCVERIAVLVGRLAPECRGQITYRSGSGERDKDREKRTPIRRGSCSNRTQDNGGGLDLSTIGRQGQRVERAPGNPGLVSFASPRTARHSYARQGL